MEKKGRIKIEILKSGSYLPKNKVNNEELEKYIGKYEDLRVMYPERYIIKMQALLIGEGYTKSQSDILIKTIESKIRTRMRP